MNPILKLVQQIKDAEGLSLAAVIEKVEQIRKSDIKTKEDVKKVANALVSLRRAVEGIPLTKEVQRLEKAIEDAEKRLLSDFTKDIESVRSDLRTTETKLRQEIDDKIPDVVTVTERVNEIEKALNDEDYQRVIEKVKASREVAESVRDFFEEFEGDERLDASAIKNLPQMGTLTAGGGSNLSVFSDGAFVGSSTRINFTGATVTNEGGRLKVAVTGGSSTFVALTDTPSAYTGEGGKAVVVNGTEDGLEFTAFPSGSGDVVGPASSTDNTLPRFNGATGKLIQGSGIVVDDSNNVSGVGTLNTHTIPGGTGTLALTSQLHDAVTVTDSSEINFTLTGQDITASLVAGSIDETKLDTSVNASLDLADSALQNIVEDTTPQLGGELAAQGNNISGLGDVTFKTGATGGTLRTGTSAADKFTLQAYDVDNTTYRTLIEADAGNTVRLQIMADFLEIEDNTDTTKRVTWDLTGATTSTATDLVFSQTANRTLTFPDATDTLVGKATTDTLTNKTLTSPNINEAVALTATATELNILDGATLSTTELNYVDGVTSAIQTQLNGKQATISFGTGVETALGVNVGTAGAPVVNGGALGTPSSGTLTNCSGLPLSGVTDSTSEALGVGTLELGHATDTTLSRSAAGVLAVEGVAVPTISSTNTLTNKRVTKRTGTTTSSATPTINTDNVDFYSLTAQAEDITSFTTNLSGTPTDGQTLWIAITGTAARAITWGASFEASTVALPTTTVSTNRLDVGFVWNSVTSKWRCVASC